MNKNPKKEMDDFRERMELEEALEQKKNSNGTQKATQFKKKTFILSEMSSTDIFSTNEAPKQVKVPRNSSLPSFKKPSITSNVEMTQPSSHRSEIHTRKSSMQTKKSMNFFPKSLKQSIEPSTERVSREKSLNSFRMRAHRTEMTSGNGRNPANHISNSSESFLSSNNNGLLAWPGLNPWASGFNSIAGDEKRSMLIERFE